MQGRSVGSPSPRTAKNEVGETAKGTNTVFTDNGIVQPELVITASESREWYRRNPHARAGVLEDLAARGHLVIVPDGMMSTAVPSGRTAVPMQGARV